MLSLWASSRLQDNFLVAQDLEQIIKILMAESMLITEAKESQGIHVKK